MGLPTLQLSDKSCTHCTYRRSFFFFMLRTPLLLTTECVCIINLSFLHQSRHNGNCVIAVISTAFSVIAVVIVIGQL